MELLPAIIQALTSYRALQEVIGNDIGIYLLMDAGTKASQSTSISSDPVSFCRIVIPLSLKSIANMLASNSREGMYGATALSEAFAIANGIQVAESEPQLSVIHHSIGRSAIMDPSPMKEQEVLPPKTELPYRIIKRPNQMKLESAENKYKQIYIHPTALAEVKSIHNADLRWVYSTFFHSFCNCGKGLGLLPKNAMYTTSLPFHGCAERYF